jgi:hypothetical protein
MGCGCKNKTNIPNQNNGDDLTNSGNNTLVNKLSKNRFLIYSTKSIVFILSIPILFLILPYVFWILFRTIVLEKDSNVIKDLSKIVSRRKNKDEELDDDDDEDEEYDDEYGEDYDDITENLVDVELLNKNEKNT